METIALLCVASLIGLHSIWDFFSIDLKCKNNTASTYNNHTDLEKNVLKFFLALFPFLSLPVHRLWIGDVFEYSRDMGTAFFLFAFSIISAPSVVYLYFRAYNAALKGLSIRTLAFLLLLGSAI